MDFETTFPRHAQLRADAASADAGRSYFERLAGIVRISPLAREVHLALERKLSRLDPAAWVALRKKCAPYVCSPHATRAWEQLFSTLNEADGYLFLQDRQYESVHFLPETERPTPDLVACGTRPAVMEVKTLQRSDAHLAYLRNQAIAHAGRNQSLVRERSAELPSGLAGKFSQALARAEVQVKQWRPLATCDRYIMMIVNLDDGPDAPALLSRIDEGLVRIARQREGHGFGIVIRRPYRDLLIGIDPA